MPSHSVAEVHGKKKKRDIAKTRAPPPATVTLRLSEQAAFADSEIRVVEGVRFLASGGAVDRSMTDIALDGIDQVRDMRWRLLNSEP